MATLTEMEQATAYILKSKARILAFVESEILYPIPRSIRKDDFLASVTIAKLS